MKAATKTRERENRITPQVAVAMMARVNDRDVAAFEAIYDAFRRQVYGIALRILGDGYSAEDVTQFVFMKMWASSASFVPGDLASWISRMTRNRALDVLRYRATHVDPVLSAVDIVLECSVDEQVSRRIDAERARSAVSALPRNQRELIELCFFSGFTNQEVARRTALPLGTVKFRIRAGLRSLRSALGTEAPPLPAHLPIVRRLRDT
jgi:RNA polymerase sigma-70 factor (ECF subfamily)